MCGSSKSSKAQQTAAEQSAEAERKAGESTQKAALESQQKIYQAGQQTPEETTRLQRYSAKAITPAEQLMTEAGPISQAVAQRILERTQKPGLDYDTESAAFTEGVSLPIWRALKARGIVPPPGTEGGGGLATQQYMKGAAPALAELRTNQITKDIATGQDYGTLARTLQQYFGGQEFDLSEAIRNRLVQATEAGAPYSVQGAQAAGAGQTAAAQINQAEVQSRYAKKEEEKAQLGRMAAMIALGAISGGAGGTGALAGAAGGGLSAMGGGNKTGIDTNMLLQRALLQRQGQGGIWMPSPAPSPAENQLSYRLQAPSRRQTAGWM